MRILIPQNTSLILQAVQACLNERSVFSAVEKAGYYILHAYVFSSLEPPR